jgi:hypothetical protein
MGVSMGPDDKIIDETKALVTDPEITSVASMRSSRARTPSDSGGGDGSGAPCLWSLTQEEHVQNLKKNCRRAFGGRYFGAEWAAAIDDSPWFARFLAKIRDDPLLGNSRVEFTDWKMLMGSYQWIWAHLSVFEDFEKIGNMRARLLHLVVWMGDLEMVQKILETHLSPNKLYIDSLVCVLCNKEFIQYSALDLAIVVGESKMVDALLEKDAKVK